MAPPDETSEDAVRLMRDLLAYHYVNGGVPLPIIALVEDALKSVGQWFPDQQYPYDEDQGYM